MADQKNVFLLRTTYSKRDLERFNNNWNKKNRPQLQITELINNGNNTLFSKKVQNWDLPSKIDEHGEKEWLLLEFEQASNQWWKFYCSSLPKIGCRPSLHATMQIWFRKVMVFFFKKNNTINIQHIIIINE